MYNITNLLLMNEYQALLYSFRYVKRDYLSPRLPISREHDSSSHVYASRVGSPPLFFRSRNKNDTRRCFLPKKGSLNPFTPLTTPLRPAEQYRLPIDARHILYTCILCVCVYIYIYTCGEIPGGLEKRGM